MKERCMSPGSGTLMALAFCASVQSASALAEPMSLYVDNENGNDATYELNNPARPMRSLTAADVATWTLANAPGQPKINVYVKATETPYRLSRPLFFGGSSTVYFDWTGANQGRGEPRAKIYGSRQVGAGDWSCTSAYCYAPTPVGRVGGAFIDGSVPEKMVPVAYVSDIAPGKYLYLAIGGCQDASGQTCQGFVFVHPSQTGMAIEWVVDDPREPANGVSYAIEGGTGNRLHGGIIRYFNYGFGHGNCDVEEFSDFDIGYMLKDGMRIASDPMDRENGSTFKNVVSHHNGRHGVVVWGFEMLKVRNVTAYANAGDGFVLQAPTSSSVSNGVYGEPADGMFHAYIRNTVAHSNQGVGYRIRTTTLMDGGAAPYPTRWYLEDNLSSLNTAGEFHLVDNATGIVVRGNVAAGTNNAEFDAVAAGQ